VLTAGPHQVELDGITQAFEVVGQGPPCFVHSGGPGIDSNYLRMPLVEQYMTMIYLDPIGTGKSGLLPGGDYSVAEYARRLELLRDHLDITDGFVLGHSHGGMVGLQYALDHPGRLRGLIVYNGAPVGESDLIEEACRQVAAIAERWPDRAEMVAAVREFRRAVEGQDDVHDVESYAEHMKVILPLYFADYRRTCAELGAPPVASITVYDPARKPYEWDVRSKLGAIDVPALVLVGSYDFICPPVWAQLIHAEMPGSRLIEFSDSGHFLHLEESRKFAEAVRDFSMEVRQAAGR